MNLKKTARLFITAFTITLWVTVGVSFLWNLVFHRVAAIDWETSFRFATVLGIIISIPGSGTGMRFLK